MSLFDSVFSAVSSQVAQRGGVAKVLNAQLGMDPSQLSAPLSALLPGLIDKLTPQGHLPEGGAGQAGDLMGMLGGLLSGRTA